MGKTADVAMIQETNVDALHKEGKSQKVITERCGCLQSAVLKHIKCSETTRAMTFASAPRFRHALRQAWARARAHTRQTPDVCAHSFHLDMVVYKR